MKCNVAAWDRVLRMLVGVLLMAWSVAGGPWWGYIGLLLILTAAWRFCPGYALLRTGTLKPAFARVPIRPKSNQ